MAKRSAVVAPVINLLVLPVFLTIEDIAVIYRLSVRTIRDYLQRGEFRPLPREKYPYRWHRDDVIKDINGPSKRLKHSRHGFATTKAATTKAIPKDDADD
jgi:hypothetical protein